MVKRYTIKREAIAFKIDYERALDPQQLAVVTTMSGPLLVIAGAGSGKTRAVTYRVARLIESGTAPDRIMLVTFTNKAAAEMSQRVDGLLGIDSRRIWSGTFHSIANRILRKNATAIGYQSNYSILDTEDAKDLIETAIEDAKVDLKSRRFPGGSLLQELFSLAANKCVTIGELVTTEYLDLIPVLEDIKRVHQHFAERKKKTNAMDYDDLLINLKRLLVESEEMRTYWASQFEHILVDEYQDTNKVQADVVDLLASIHKNVMVVGDDAQSIYGWRGANFENIIGFQQRYPDAKILKLEYNYRSRPQILEVANASIAHNKQQFKKQLTATRASAGDKPGLVPLQDSDEQAAFVASRVLELHDQGTPLREIAVLYRSHWQCLEVQMELTRRNIPYSIHSGMRFFEQAHIKDVISHLRVTVNPKDEPAWKRVLKLIPSVGRSTAMKIWDRISTSDDPLKMLTREDFSARPRATEAWQSFVDMMKQLSSAQVMDNPAAQIQLVLASGYEGYLTNTYDNGPARVEDLQQLANYAARFEATQDFLSELCLISGERFANPEGTAGEDAEDAAEEDNDHMILTSVHQAKGLEWKHVFLIWAADGKFPGARSIKDVNALEEERRLFYVATTRAKDELCICYPLMQSDYSRMNVIQRPSRFVTEIPENLFEIWSVD